MVKEAVDQKENNDQTKVSKKDYWFEAYFTSEEITAGDIRKVRKLLKEKIAKEDQQ